MIEATVIADSVGVDAPRLTTFQLIYPRFIHAEVMTHRMFSRNASSSRAIPTQRMLAAIGENPARPIDWRMNEPGMQGFNSASEGCVRHATEIWDAACSAAIQYARAMDAAGLHKQIVNRLTEPFQHIRVVLTATDFDNFFGLRDHEAAEPHIQMLAREMKKAMEESTPKLLGKNEWHLPYIDESAMRCAYEWLAESRDGHNDLVPLICAVSAARCARVSYKTHDGSESSMEADMALYQRLVGSSPIHASPTEHQATPDFWMARGKSWLEPQLHGNLTGWQQFRKTLPHENLQRPVIEEAA